MDPYSSGEELVIKSRKPYTITKQRERWTEDEHNRFLEALKLYGRAWQRIEEHIGTKTAVQIRSHAQKFFTKLEKEALVKGVPIGQALDIEIPPPRPKRKPSNPYPRKIGAGTPTLQVAAKESKQVTAVSLCSGKQILDLEEEPVTEKTGGRKMLWNAKEGPKDEANFTDNPFLIEEAPLLSSANNESTSKHVADSKSCTLQAFVPIWGDLNSLGETNGSNITVEAKGIQKFYENDTQFTVTDKATSNTSDFENHLALQGDLVEGQKTSNLSQPEYFDESSISDTRGGQSNPGHIPVHVADGNQGMSVQDVFPEILCEESTSHPMGRVHPQHHQNLFANLSAFTTSNEHLNNVSRTCTFSTFHPIFTPVCNNQGNYQPFFQLTSTFSNLIVSALLQNPAAHAAANFAASFWPSAVSSGDSSVGGFPLGQLNTSTTPSMASIAAATLAAATAWWAAHGLLPSCGPHIHSGFTCPHPSLYTAAAAASTQLVNSQATLPVEGNMLDPGQAEALLEQHSASKDTNVSSSEDSEGSEDRKLDAGLTAADTGQPTAEAELQGSSNTKIRKQVDRSSCGSNTTSSSEIETDCLEKHEKSKDDTEELHVSHPASDSCNRRSRGPISLNDSWKEVSEEGKLAFRALFSREVLPQSFSPPYEDFYDNVQQKNNFEKARQKITENSEGLNRLDLNSNSGLTCSSPQPEDKQAHALFRGEKHGEQGLVTMGLGHVKLKTNQTGFKPYKRCSTEAKESRMMGTGSQTDEKGPKRVCLEGQTST